MTNKAPQPNDVRMAIKESVTELNKLLKIADSKGLTIVIKPDNSTSRRISATKSVMVITYPEIVN